MKITTVLLAFVVVVLIIVAAEQHHSITNMKQQLEALSAQPVSSDTLAVATADSDTDPAAPALSTTALAPASAPTPAPPASPPAQLQQQPAPVDPQANSQPNSPSAGNQPGDPLDIYNSDPYREIERMQAEMDRLMNEAFNRHGYDPYYGPRGGPDMNRRYGPNPRPNYGPDPRSRRDSNSGFHYSMHDSFSSPKMDLRDKGDKYLVLIDLPGTDADSISVTLDGDVLSVSARQSSDKKDTDAQGNVIFRSHRSGSFRRSMSLPGPVKQSGMKTDYDKGVLRITIPKA